MLVEGLIEVLFLFWWGKDCITCLFWWCLFIDFRLLEVFKIRIEQWQKVRCSCNILVFKVKMKFADYVLWKKPNISLLMSFVCNAEWAMMWQSKRICQRHHHNHFNYFFIVRKKNPQCCFLRWSMRNTPHLNDKTLLMFAFWTLTAQANRSRYRLSLRTGRAGQDSGGVRRVVGMLSAHLDAEEKPWM